jgi:translation elongation factor EF-1beta
MKKYIVRLTKYPEEYEVEAENKEEAIKKAKEKIDYSVWDSEVEEI